MRKISVLLFGWLLLGNGSAFGQSAQMVSAAKKEGGKVIVYTSMETFTADALKKAFEAKTGLQMEYWRGGSTEVLDRSLAEFRVGKPLFDIVAMTGDHMHVLAKEGVFTKYNRRRSKALPKKLSIRTSAPATGTFFTASSTTKPASRLPTRPRRSKMWSSRSIVASSSCPIR